MPITVAMYDKSYDYIRERLGELELDLEVLAFGKDGLFRSAAKVLRPADVDVDYMWLSTHINGDGFRDGAFELALAAKRIGVLQTFNAGLDHPFYKKISDKGTRICNSSAQGVAIAEYVLGQVLAVLQPIAEQRELQRQRKWQQTPFRELSETRWLLIGFGPIGQEIAKRIRAFGAVTDVVRRSPADSDLADRVGTMADLETFLPDADIVVLACSLNDTTRDFAGKDFFAAMKPGAILVNIARGGLIDDAALLAALDGGKVGTAILDVFRQEPLPASSPYWDHPKVRLTGHTSFAGSGGRGRWDALFLDNIARFARGEALVQEVRPADIV